VFMGEFTYPHGMAGTKRIQHAIDALKGNSEVSVRVLIQRQSSKTNVLSGIYEGTPYDTIMGDLLRAKMVVMLPLLWIKTICSIRKAWRDDCKNIIHYYGPLSFESIVPLYYSRNLGYRIVFDIVEDVDAARVISNSIYHRIKMHSLARLSSRTMDLASGIVVISSRLESKYHGLVRGCIPVYLRPISVDLDRFPNVSSWMNVSVSLFYAGSFGKKDGIPVLIDAFEKVAERRHNVRLVLSGIGDHEAMRALSSCIESSPYKERIEYKGYLNEQAYYALLNSIDIPCMSRIAIEYAHAGFPFKLGEFLATGKPVIASKVSDINNFLKNKYNAILVEPGDSDDLAAAVEYLIDHPDAAAAIGKQGREVARSLFDYRTQGESLLSFLEKL